MQKTKLIAAYPCMGKTTLTNLNRDRLLNRLLDFGYKITIVFPDISTARALHSYRNRVLERSGSAWWGRVLAPEINSVPDRIRQLRNMGCSVIVADEGEYLEDVIEFGDWLVRLESK